MDRIGDYRLDAELVETPAYRTYRATHQVLPREVIVKIATDVRESVAVLREACILAALPHPGIIAVYEVGRLVDQRTWFASEIIDGLSLAGTLALGPLDPGVAVGIVRDAAEILAHAHQRGVVHAALAPEHIVITGPVRGFPLCITDWSAARTHDSQTMHAWAPGPYTAPELLRGELDDRADVYALGALAYHAFTGEAYEGKPFASLAPELPASVAALVESMLAHNRWDRPSSAEVRAELGNVASATGGELDAALGAEVEAPDEVLELQRIRRPRWTPALQFAPGERAETAADDELDPTMTE